MCTRSTSKFEEIHELFVLDAPFGAGIAAIFLEKRAEVPSLDFVDTCDKYACACSPYISMTKSGYLDEPKRARALDYAQYPLLGKKKRN